MLCSVCSGIDLASLLFGSKDESLESEAREKAVHPEHLKGAIKHHDDIFKIRASADNGCELCQIILKAFTEAFIDSTGGTIKFCEFDLYIPPDDFSKSKQKPRRFLRKIDKDPASESSLKIVSNWLDNCINNHNCDQYVPGSYTLPKRVLNVGNQTTDPFLVEHSADSPSGSWTALSYCWGKSGDCKQLNEDTINDLKRAIPINTLDATIRDAILVTRALGIAYLWVDALCIMQGQDNKQDWIEQSSKMDVIYGNSTLTIIAADSSSSREGFLKERKLQYLPLCWFPSGLRLHSSIAEKLHIAPSWNKKNDKITGQWSTRGWTMQEGILPNRLLCFTSNQTIWQCCTATEYERGVIRYPLHEVINGFTGDEGGKDFSDLDIYSMIKILPSIPERDISERYSTWYMLVKDYSSRCLTKREDRLVAFSGLAKLFGQMLRDDEYVAGLWKRDLVRGLVWYATNAKLVTSKISSKTREDDRSRDEFPSWTWASAASGVVVNDLAKDDAFQPCVDIHDVQVELVDKTNPFGDVRGGRITITGPMSSLVSLYNNEWQRRETPMSAFERYVSSIVEEESAPGKVLDKFINGQFTALKILRHFPSLKLRYDLLILERTGGIENGMAIHRRLGLLTPQYFQEPPLSPSLLALIEELEEPDKSLRSELHGRTRRKTTKLQPREVFEEIDAWPRQSIIII